MDVHIRYPVPVFFPRRHSLDVSKEQYYKNKELPKSFHVAENLEFQTLNCHGLYSAR
jgi:hypothetical protein